MVHLSSIPVIESFYLHRFQLVIQVLSLNSGINQPNIGRRLGNPHKVSIQLQELAEANLTLVGTLFHRLREEELSILIITLQEGPKLILVNKLALVLSDKGSRFPGDPLCF